MALPAWQATIVTGKVSDGGDIIPSPVITVIVEETGQPAVLFSNRAGTTPLGNNGVFTGGVDGFAQFFVAPGEYRVTASDAGSGFSQTWRYIVLLKLDELFTTGNLNPDVFGFVGGGRPLGVCHGTSSTTVALLLPVSIEGANATGIDVRGTFKVVDFSGANIGSAIGDSRMNVVGTTNKYCKVEFTGLAGIVVSKAYELETDSSDARITVEH